MLGRQGNIVYISPDFQAIPLRLNSTGWSLDSPVGFIKVLNQAERRISW
jgi:hypothetical protein